jgi:hypothetical protein
VHGITTGRNADGISVSKGTENGLGESGQKIGSYPD